MVLMFKIPVCYLELSRRAVNQKNPKNTTSMLEMRFYIVAPFRGQRPDIRQSRFGFNLTIHFVGDKCVHRMNGRGCFSMG